MSYAAASSGQNKIAFDDPVLVAELRQHFSNSESDSTFEQAASAVLDIIWKQCETFGSGRTKLTVNGIRITGVVWVVLW